MIEPSVQERILALDLRPRSFGYVVFEGPAELLEWGVRSFRSGTNTVRVPAHEKLARLLEEYVPSTLVVKEVRPSADSKTAVKLKEILDAIKAEARRHRVAIRSI